MKPLRKATKGRQLTGGLQGELATYEKVGLFQRSINKKSAYRYRGVLLRYQEALNGATPMLERSAQFLAHLRKQGFSPNTLKVYRAALQGFHAWRGEQLVFQIRIPHHAPEYIEPTVVGKRSGDGFVAHKAMLVSALARALADRVMLLDLTIGRKGLLKHLA